MKWPRLLHSPLAATAGILLGLGLLAIPLHQLTSRPDVQLAPTDEPTPSSGTPSWTTLRLLEPADAISLRTPSGDTLWTGENLPAGHHEFRLDLPIDRGALELVLDVQLQHPDKETAAFLSVAPDGLAKQTRHTIGSGALLELMNFNWPQPD